MSYQGKTSLPDGQWVPNGKGTLRYEASRPRRCPDCGADTTFSEDSHGTRCLDCKEKARHELVTDELAAMFEDLPDDDWPFCARPGCRVRFERLRKGHRYCSKPCSEAAGYLRRKTAA